MLRCVAFRNVIHFKEFHLMTFKKEPYLFIGGNSSGKSAIFEIIRRCLPLDKNVSLSSVYDKAKIAYTFSHFELPDNTAVENIYSGFIKTTSQGKPFWIKVLWIKHKTERSSPLCAIRYEVEEDKLINESKKHKIVHFKSLSDREVENFEWNEESFNSFVDKILECMQNEESEIELPPSLRSDLEGMTFLDQLDLMYVATMPMRSIGALQWTKSDKITERTNYQEACDRAEIISALMDSDDVDHDKEKEIFKFMTYPLEFRFESEIQNSKRKIFVYEEKSSNQFPLLKTPEGLVEAKQFSLIMAHKGYYTVCLEEPDRGMHPQWVERMRDILQTLCTKKVVIIVSHNPFFVNSITAKNAFIFFKTYCDNGVVHSMMSIKEINRTITDTDNLKKLIFSSKILIVEGVTDKIVLEGLFEHILRLSNSEMAMPDRHSIASHQLIALGSNSFIEPIKKFCSKANVQCNWLFDRNTYVILDNDKKIYKIKSPEEKDGNICASGSSEESLLRCAQTFTQGRKRADTFSNIFFQSVEKSRKKSENQSLYEVIDQTQNAAKEFLKTTKDIQKNVDEFSRSLKPPGSGLKKNKYSKFLNKDVQEFLNDDDGFGTLSGDLSKHRIFIWKDGDIEDIIRKGITTTDPDCTKLEKIFGNKDVKNSEMKNKLKGLERDKLNELVAAIYKSDEIQRFVEFLKVKHF